MNSESRQVHKQALPAGFDLGSYRVVRVLGVGGFGVTYLCEHAGLGVQVAVKEYLPNEIAVRDGTAVHPKSAGDREGFEWGLSRFLDEARTLARFQHPNVVRVRDCFEANNTAYIVMDYEDGEPLDALLERHGTLTEAQLKRVVLPVADGLRQVHAAGFLHRDVKPSNIFVRRSDESPVLLDFGSARQALGRKSRSITAIASAGYSPPEQYESRGDQGAWTDIYALSALCHRAITGEAPVEAPRRTGEVARSRADPQASLAAAGVAGYSSGFLQAVDSGLRLIETERPQSLDDWLARMEQAATSAVAGPGTGKPSPLVPSSAAEQSGAREAHSGRRRAALSSLALGALLVTLATIGLIGTKIGWLPTEQGAIPQYRESSEQAEQEDADAQQMGAGEEVPGSASPAAPRTTPPLSLPTLAEQGDAEAQFELGRAYFTGEDVRKDVGEAVRWYRKAAEQGHAAAQHFLGVLYHFGAGVPKDIGEAARWYRGAAEQGHALAQFGLGTLYANGEGVPKDAGEAARWYRGAAERGYAPAQFSPGFLYATGEGVPKDPGEAAWWYATGEGLPIDSGEAVRWFREAAEQGYAPAQDILGLALYYGEGVPNDVGEAARWFREAAEQGDASAQYHLGILYTDGDGVPKDAAEAARWYRKAAEQGHAAAQLNLGVLYHSGEGVPTDYVQAYAWWNLAASQGDDIAARNRASLQVKMTPTQIGEAQKLTRELIGSR